MDTTVSRRDFVKVGGVAGVMAGSMGIGSIVGVEPADAQPAQPDVADVAAPEAQAEVAAGAADATNFVFTCPECGLHTMSHDDLKRHVEESHPGFAVPECASLRINGSTYQVQVEPQWTLRETLQKAIGVGGGAKMMCDHGACGSCSVLIDGVPALACATLAVECDGREIETSEGIAADPTWRPLVEAYARNDAAQCGYCTPGQFTVAKYIIQKYGQPTEDQIRYELSGNICRCGTYARHVKAITEAAAEIGGSR